MPGGVLFLDFHRFKIFRLEDLAAIEAFDVIYSVSPGNYLGAGMVASGLHKQRLDEDYFNRERGHVKPHHD